ncbi:hypothetical protein BDV93DRAFT_507444 [Ceratobasidium sp. AG-I]|nr:hypothetical protein BDV93DRAFT_507444 [Ceratobasidium sp. AG-I]
MWRHNGTYDWARCTLTEADHQFIRREAQIIDASGINQKACIEATMALEAWAETGQAQQAKALEKKSANTQRLAEINIVSDATYDDLLCLKIPELDNQIDKLRQTDKSIRAKSKIRNKRKKIMEILGGLKCRKEFFRSTSSQIQYLEAINAGIDVFEEGGDLSEDQEMLFNDEVLL